MIADLPTWQRVAEDAELLRRAAACDPQEVASVARLRKRYNQDETAVALELVKARRKAAVKFPQHADQMVADAAGVEQATSFVAARHKAERFRAAGVEHLIDLCCGVGGDSLGFVAAGLDVLAVDRDPVRAWMAGVNAGCATRVADADELLTPDASSSLLPGAGAGFPGAGVGVHLDPARRTDAGRVFRLADYQPDPATIRRWIGRFPDAAVKLSPAVNLEELEDELPDGEIEFISEAGRLVQGVLWTGRLQQSARSATLLVDGRTHTLTDDPGTPPLASPARFLFTVDPAVERAGLMHTLGLPAIHPKLGLLTAERRDDVPRDAAPWLTGFELLAELPWHSDHPRQVLAWLADHDGGIVEVKTRGKAVDPDRVQQQLRGKGGTPHTVFVLRFDQRLVALITRRL